MLSNRETGVETDRQQMTYTAGLDGRQVKLTGLDFYRETQLKWAFSCVSV